MLLITLVWGFAYIPGKVGLSEIPPFLFTGLRFILLSAVLLPFLKRHSGQMPLILLIATMAGALHFGLFYGGLALAHDISTVAVFAQLNAPFSTLLAAIVLREQVGWRRWLGIALAFGGVMVIGFDPVVFRYVDALVLLVFSALTMAIAAIAMRKLRDVGVFDLQGWVALLSWPVLLALSFAFESGQIEALRSATWRGWSGVVYTALGASLIGHAGLYYLLQRYEVSKTAPLTLIATLFGIAFGVLLMGDRFTPRMALGSVATLTGVAIVVFSARPLKLPAAALAAEEAAAP